MVALIDAGNSFVKVVFWNGKTFENAIQIPTGEVRKFFPVKGESAVISSVVPSLNETFKKAFKKTTFVNARIPLPVKIDYKNPERLGADRIALACGILDYENSGIVVSAGTTVVVDIVIEKTFIGGIILPGVKAIHRALNLVTEQLPEVENRFIDKLPGKSTAECIKVGTALALKGAVKEVMEKYSGLPVVFTGGYGNILKEMIGKGTYDPFLIFKGMVKIVKEK
ncbi:MULTISPECIES: type III pantothenate kinase [unclassified Desulfurobacterium]|uniref:type III pantothenate kinase n=1 Tax=Desulfurobacterium sp. TC5-1 TaxID=1158318 RepID=UPI0003B64FCF|nr:type III pantothenate kinase [Desulfurobacterium sp. TC5-1]